MTEDLGVFARAGRRVDGVLAALRAAGAQGGAQFWLNLLLGGAWVGFAGLDRFVRELHAAYAGVDLVIAAIMFFAAYRVRGPAEPPASSTCSQCPGCKSEETP